MGFKQLNHISGDQFGFKWLAFGWFDWDSYSISEVQVVCDPVVKWSRSSNTLPGSVGWAVLRQAQSVVGEDVGLRQVLVHRRSELLQRFLRDLGWKRALLVMGCAMFLIEIDDSSRVNETCPIIHIPSSKWIINQYHVMGISSICHWCFTTG